MHRVSQAVTGIKAPDVKTDTIKSIRQRNNKRLPFHKTLQFLSNQLLAETKPSQIRGRASAGLPDADDCETDENRKRKAAPRLNARNKKTRFETNHNVFSSARKLGVTPFGKGRKVAIAEKHPDFHLRCMSCPGRPIKLAAPKTSDAGEIIAFNDNKRQCYLCKKHGCNYMCIGCHRILCYETDRQTEIQAMLMNDGPDRERLLNNVPEFRDQHRNFAPAHYVDLGEINGQTVFAYMSCFHYAHGQGRFFVADDDIDECRDDAEDGQLCTISEAAPFSPNATR
jgi:hypothetical protein